MTTHDEPVVGAWPFDPALARLAFGASLAGPRATSASMAAAMHDVLHGGDGRALDLDDPAQRAFGDYELLELLGQGGMGMVFRARQHRLGREVAIKLLSAGAWAPEPLVDGLRREARHAAKLQHANIVTVFEMGEHDGLIFYAMQLVRGRTLSHQLDADGPMAPRAAARLLRTIAEAVDYAHRLGVLHLDLKPGNILLDERGEPLVTDFGLARGIEQAFEREGIAGTPGYMAPEQARTDGPELSPATDVWALGAVLYETLTGHAPFEGADAADTLRLLREGDVRRPGRYRSVPADLEAICLHCLRKDPARRYPDARAVADELGRFLEGRAVAVRPLGPLQRLARWGRREPRVALGVAFAALSLLAGVVATSVQWRRAEANARTASERLWDTRRESAMRAGMDGDGQDGLPRLLANIEELERAGDADAALLDRRRYGLLAAQGAQLIDGIAIADANPLAVELNEDGSLLAIACNDLSVRWYGTDDLAERGRVSLQGRPGADGQARVPILLRFTGDGRLRATLHWYDNASNPTDGDTWLVDLAQKAIVSPPAAFGRFADANFSADGRHALLRNRERHVQLWATSPWRAVSGLVDPGASATVDDVGWQLGPRVAAMLPVGMQSLELLRVPTLQPAGRVALPDQVGISAWNQSPDGRRIALGNFDGRLFVYDVDAGRLRTLPTARGREVTWVAFSDDGAWLGAATQDGTAYAFDAGSGETLVAGQMRHDFALRRVGIDRAQRLLVASGDGQVGLWRIPQQGPRAAPAQRIGLAPARHALTGPYPATWSFRSGLLATAGIDGQVRLWRLPRPPSLPARAPRQIADAIAFDGRHVVDVEWNRLRLHPLAGGSPTPWLTLPQPPGFAELADDGRTLVATVGAALHVYDVPSMVPRFAPLALPASPTRLLVAPGGARVLLAFGAHGASGFEDRLRQVDLRRGALLPGEVALPGPVRQLAFAPDGARVLAVGPAEAATDLLDGRSLRRLAQFPHDPFQPVAWAAFAAAGKDLWLATRAPDARLGSDALLRWDPNADSVRRQTPLGALEPLSVVALGSRAYVAGIGGDVLVEGDGTARRAQRVGHGEATAVVATSPDARLVAHASRREVQLLDARTGAAIGAPLQADINAVDALQQLAFAPDGNHLLGRSLQGQWLLWTIAPERRPAEQLAQRLAITSRGDGAPAGRLVALTPAQRKALRDDDPGPWPALDDRPVIPASHRANAGWQVGRPFLDRGPIPDRTGPVSPLMLDLAPVYNRSPDGVQVPFYSTRPQLRPYPAGVQRIGGVAFDVRGIMDIGREVDHNLPGARCVAVPAIRATAVHALMQPVLRQPVDRVATVAELTWRYADGSVARAPIRTLRELPGFAGRDQAVPQVFGLSLASQAYGLQGETLSAPRLPNPQPLRVLRELCFAIVGGAEPVSIFALTLEAAAPSVGSPVIAPPVSRNSP